jgi:DegV family protein with EDD domain
MPVISQSESFKDDFENEKEYNNFYAKIAKGEVFKTASLNSVELTEHFLSLLKLEKDIIHFSISSGLSLTHSVAKEVADKLNAESKNKIYIVDTLSATQGQNLLVHYAIDLRDAGVFPHEAFDKISSAVNNLDVSFFVTDFDCLKRGGRIGGAQAVIGKLVGIRPILDFDKLGKLRVVQKVIGNKKALLALSSKLEDYDEQMGLPIFIAHTGEMNLVEGLQAEITKLYPNAKVIKNYIGPTIGAHVGNNALGLVFLGKKERE